MPAFTFTDPSGKSYTVNGPDGATQDQAWAMLQQQLKSQPTYNPTDGMSEMDKFWAGAGKSVVDTGRGLGQLAMQAGNKLGMVSDQGLAANQQDISDSRKQDAPLAATTAGKVGQFAGDAAMLATAPEGLAGAAVGSAALAGAQPTVGDESRASNTAIGAAGGAAGFGAGKVLGAVAQPITDRLGALGQQFRQILTQEGVPLDAAQATGSKVAQTLKNAGSDAPLTGHTDFPQQQAEQFTRATLEKMGIQNATEASPGVMQAGRQRLKDAYNGIAARNTINYDPPLNQDISQIRYEASRNLTPENAQVIHNKLDDLETMVQANGGNGMTGAGYEQFQSGLGKIAKDGGKAPFVTDIRQALTGALQRQATPGDAALLSQTNQRYAAMKAIQQSIDSNTNLVSPSKLYNSLDTTKGANGTVYGQGPNQALIGLAQAGKALIGKTTANSGTAQRSAGLAVVGGIGAEAYDLASGKPMNSGDALKGAVALGLAPEVAQRLVYSNAGRATLQRWAQSRIAGSIRQGAAGVGGVAGGATATQGGPALQQTVSQGAQ